MHNNPMSEIWSTNIEAYPMNRSMTLEVSKIRRIKSEWREYLYGDKFYSCITFYDKNGDIIGKMLSLIHI